MRERERERQRVGEASQSGGKKFAHAGKNGAFDIFLCTKK